MPRQTQEERIKELLNKYAAFIHQPQEDKVKIIRLCGILSYIEAAEEAGMTIMETRRQLTHFLDKIVTPYTGGDDNGQEERKG